jgi:hypothetical protein
MGWLIEPLEKTVKIYRSPLDVRVLNTSQNGSGENILSGSILEYFLI